MKSISRGFKYKVIPTSNHNKAFQNTYLLDIRDLDIVEEYLNEIRPDIVINCAGLLISESQNRLEDALVINSLFPNVLSRLGNVLDFKLIHISTDCVFSGYKGKYNEHDYRDGRGIYAQTKILGEVYEDTNLTLRTSIVGPELHTKASLMEWFLSCTGEINGYSEHFCNANTTLEWTKQCLKLMIDWDLYKPCTVIGSKCISKFELLTTIKKVFNKNIHINPSTDNKANKCLIPDIETVDIESQLIELKEWNIT